MTDAARRRSRALPAAIELGRSLGITCDQARIIKDSNNTIVHLAPAPLIAKVGTTTLQPDDTTLLAKELHIGEYLADRGAPIAAPADEVPAGPHRAQGLDMTLWRYVGCAAAGDTSDAALAQMLIRFHRALANYPGDLPDFTDNLTRAKSGLEDRGKTPQLLNQDRSFLVQVANELEESLQDADFERHPLHGQPHLDGNILWTEKGPLLVDFEGACRGPYEWDITSLERARSAYPHLDTQLFAKLSRMRNLCVTTWCWMQYGRAPEIDEAAYVHLAFLRSAGSRTSLRPLRSRGG